MSRRGCSTSVLIVLALVIAAVVALLLWLGSEPNAIRMRVQADHTRLAVGESMALSVTIENVSLDPVLVRGIGLEADLAEGVTLVQTLVGGQPQSMPVDERDYPVLGAWTEYALDREIAPGELLDVTFVLEAVTPGAYVGEITAWIESGPLGLPLLQARRESFDYSVQ